MGGTDQWGQLADTVIEQGMKIDHLSRIVDGMGTDVMRLGKEQTDMNGQLIRFDEQLKGIREQNKDHHKTQLENDTKQAQALENIAISLRTLFSAMGLEQNSENSVTEMRKDFFKIRENRLNGKSLREYTMKALVTAIVGGALVLLVTGAVEYFNSNVELRHDLGEYQNGPQTTIPKLRNR